MTDQLTKSSSDTWDKCHKEYWFRYVACVVPDKESPPARVGLAFHAGMRSLGNGGSVTNACEAVNEFYRKKVRRDDIEVEQETVRRMVCAWHWRWGEDGIENLDAEEVFRGHPIVNPDTGSPAKKHTLSGRTDQIIKLPDGRLALREFKTTGDDISPGSDYWPHLNMDRQVNIYYMVQSQDNEKPVTTILYDVMRRPGIKPKIPAKKDVADWPMYYGEKVDLEEPPERETPAMYGARLTADFGERPGFYFARREIGVLEFHTKDTQRDIWQIHLAILNSERHGHWGRSTRSCFDHGRCPYFSICSAGVDVTESMPEGFHHEEPHSELED